MSISAPCLGLSLVLPGLLLPIALKVLKDRVRVRLGIGIGVEGSRRAGATYTYIWLGLALEKVFVFDSKSENIRVRVRCYMHSFSTKISPVCVRVFKNRVQVPSSVTVWCD